MIVDVIRYVDISYVISVKLLNLFVIMGNVIVMMVCFSVFSKMVSISLFIIVIIGILVIGGVFSGLDIVLMGVVGVFGLGGLMFGWEDMGMCVNVV